MPTHGLLEHSNIIMNKYNNIGRNGSFFNVAGYLIEERCRWPIINASPRGQSSKKFRIWKERHIQMRENRASHLVG